MENKPFWESKTIWFNVLVTLAAILTAVAEFLTTEQAVTVLAVFNVVMRVVSSKAVTWFK